MPEVAEMPVTGRKADTLLLQQGANDNVEDEEEGEGEEDETNDDDPLPSSTISTWLVVSSSLIASSPLPSKVLVLLLWLLERLTIILNQTEYLARK